MSMSTARPTDRPRAHGFAHADAPPASERATQPRESPRNLAWSRWSPLDCSRDRAPALFVSFRFVFGEVNDSVKEVTEASAKGDGTSELLTPRRTRR